MRHGRLSNFQVISYHVMSFQSLKLSYRYKAHNPFPSPSEKVSDYHHASCTTTDDVWKYSPERSFVLKNEEVPHL
jgi:hypothetical protein